VGAPVCGWPEYVPVSSMSPASSRPLLEELYGIGVAQEPLGNSNGVSPEGELSDGVDDIEAGKVRRLCFVPRIGRGAGKDVREEVPC